MTEIKNTPLRKYEIIVIGTSAGGLDVLSIILPKLKSELNIPVVIVQHIKDDSDDYLIKYLNDMSQLNVKEAEEKETPEKGTIYFAPPDYHLLIEENKSFSLSIDKKVNYARPSINVLFETAASVFKEKTIGVILTGANSDGASGMNIIYTVGGLTLVQNPVTAEHKEMPVAAIKAVKPDFVAEPEEIAKILNKLN